ncbi:MAG: hypothetical protein HY795_00895 [Desulfovibrio sp.]|jgi:hypothetical protein|nr:hypothetical protein [Desulfovibrio sp.]
MRSVILLVFAFAVASVFGCSAKPMYESPERTQAQMERDFSDCDWEAARATGNVAKGGDRQARIEELLDKCMKAKGYKKN